MKKLKIGMVCYPTFGGSGVVATELGKTLGQKNYEVHFITYSQPMRLDFFSQNMFYHEVSFQSYPLFKYPPYEMALTSKIVDIAKFQKLDLLHVHYAIPHASAAYQAKQILREQGIHLPFITTLHGTDITLVGKDPSYEPVVSFSINKSDGVTAVSENLKKETFNHFDITQDITVIPNFINLARFKKHKKEHFKTAICPNEEKLVVHISNFRQVKRVDDVLRIFKNIASSIPAKLLLVGDGPERANIETLSRDLCLTDNVHFLGKVDVIEEVLSVADLFLMPSEKESFGLAALEAMACQVPVVSSNAGGIPELNIHGKTGFTSPVGAILEMSKNALHILDDKHLASFKAAALARASELDINIIVPQYEAFYRKIVEQKKPF